MDKYKKAREKIRKIIYPIYCSDIWYIDGMIDRILSLPDILVKDEEQELPFISLKAAEEHDTKWAASNFSDSLQEFGKKAQQDMLSNNWVKVLKK